MTQEFRWVLWAVITLLMIAATFDLIAPPSMAQLGLMIAVGVGFLMVEVDENA